MQQRALARSDGAHDGKRFAVADIHGDALEHLQHRAADAIRPFDLFTCQNRFHLSDALPDDAGQTVGHRTGQFFGRTFDHYAAQRLCS